MVSYKILEADNPFYLAAKDVTPHSLYKAPLCKRQRFSQVQQVLVDAKLA